MQSATPTAATYIRVDPSGFTLTGTGSQFFGTGSNTSANIGSNGCTIGGCLGAGPSQVVWTFALPSYVNPSNVTAVYASATLRSYLTGNNNGQEADGVLHCDQGINSFSLLPVSPSTSYGPFYGLTQYNKQMTAVTGSQVSTITCTARVSSGNPVQAGLTLDIPAIYLQLADSIDTAPATNTIYVAPPLSFNQSLSTLSLTFPLDAITDTGASNAYVLTNPNFNLSVGTSFKMIPAHANSSTTPTLALNGIPGATIEGPTGGAISANDITTTAVAVFIVGIDGNPWLQNPQTASGGGTSVNVNGSPVSNPNFNGTTPAAGSNGKNIAFQVSGSNVSGEIVGDGNVAHFLNGQGGYTAPSVGSACPPGWVCITSTGTDWGTQCTAALATLGAGGGIIYTAPGTYTMANNCHVNQNNISFLGAGSVATVIDVTTSGDGLTYQMNLSTPTDGTLSTSNSFSGMRFLGNGTSGQIPVHFKDTRGVTFTDAYFDHGGAASPCVEFENVTGWTEENKGDLTFGQQCFAAVELFQDNEANFSFGYNYLNIFVQVSNGQFGLYIPVGGVTSSMFNGSITLTGDVSGTGVLVYNHGMNIGGDGGSIIVPTTINVQTEGVGGTIWDVGASFWTIFTSPSGINTQSASQGTAYSVANKFYPYNSQGGADFYLKSLTSTSQLATDANGKIIAGTPFISSITTTGTSGPATVSGGVLNVPQYTGGGGGGGSVTNITGSSQVTATGCTQSASTGGTCAVSGSSTTAVTFSVIPGSYLNLRLVVYGVSTSGTQNVKITYNSDTGANYALQGYFQQAATAPSDNNAVSATGCVVGTLSTFMGAFDLNILGYTDTNLDKLAFYEAGLFTSISSNTSNFSTQGPCVWNNSGSAITSITATIASQDFGANTKFILYGIN